MNLSLSLLTDIAGGKLTPEKALQSMLLPAMRKSNTPTLILKIKPKDRLEFNLNEFNSNEIKNEDFTIIQEYWKEDFDFRMSAIKSSINDFIESNNNYKELYEALEIEHRELIGLYNKKITLKKSK